MLLKEYLLLNLGRITLGEARRWQAEMSARRLIDASRDLLAFWQPRADDEPARNGQLVGFAVFSSHRFMGEMELAELQDGLTLAVQRAIGEFGLHAEVSGRRILTGQALLARVECRWDDAVLLGEVYLEALTVWEYLLREVPVPQLANAVAYHVEQVFGYAPAAVHPVAYEEQMRSKE